MNNEKPLNKPLIIISAIVVFSFSGFDACVKPAYLDGHLAAAVGVAMIFIAPLIALWAKALWNNIIPRITSWREITFIETLGLMTLFLLLFG